MRLPKFEYVEPKDLKEASSILSKVFKEGTQLAPAPAIVNAIYDAIGVDFNELPVTPEHILKELRNKHDKAGSREKA